MKGRSIWELSSYSWMGIMLLFILFVSIIVVIGIGIDVG